MTQFEILCERQSLSHCNVAVGLEQHHGKWLSGLHVTDDEFGDDIETKLDVRNGLDHTNGNGEHEGDHESNDERPPGKMSIIGKCAGKRERENAEESNAEPPPWNFLVLAHHLGVYVRLFAQ